MCARNLVQDLKDIGAAVVWLDKGALRPGDEWEREIMGALKRCTLVLPVISARTESRDEGYFRREWHEIAERSLRIQGRRFIYPVVVDTEFDGDALGYQRVPERFREFQFGHAPGGRMNDDLREALKEAVRNFQRHRAA